MQTDFSPKKFIKERYSGDIYLVESWVRNGGTSVVTLVRWDMFGNKETQSLRFSDDRLFYYSEYYLNTVKPREWYGPKGRRMLIDGICKPVFYFVLDKIFKRNA